MAKHTSMSIIPDDNARRKSLTQRLDRNWIFNFTRGAIAGWLAAALTFVGLLALWLVLPLAIRSRADALPAAEHESSSA